MSRRFPGLADEVYRARWLFGPLVAFLVVGRALDAGAAVMNGRPPLTTIFDAIGDVVFPVMVLQLAWPASELTRDDQANDCRHWSATGVDSTPVSDPSKVWRCDHCGLRWLEGSR